MRLGYVILYVPDVESSVTFYEKAFGLSRRFVHESGMYAEMETGGTTLAFTAETFTPPQGLFQLNRRSDKPAGAEIAFVVADVRQGFDRAVAAGAVAVFEPTRKPWGQTVAYVRDGDGFLVEICDEIDG